VDGGTTGQGGVDDLRTRRWTNSTTQTASLRTLSRTTTSPGKDPDPDPGDEPDDPEPDDEPEDPDPDPDDDEPFPEPDEPEPDEPEPDPPEDGGTVDDFDEAARESVR